MHLAALKEEIPVEPRTVGAPQKGALVRLLTCGSVDDGKSTLIGRLLWDAAGVTEDQRAAVARLGGAHRERHCEAAPEQDGGVEHSEAQIQDVAPTRERWKVEEAVDGIRSESSAKKHDFGDQE